MKDAIWIDQKGRSVLIYTMSDKWLNNIKKYLIKKDPNSIDLKSIKNEIKRRKIKRSKKLY